MLLLGHLGIGSRLLGPLRRRWPASAVYLGCVLPDLIDKPLYYALSLSTGRQGAALGLISGTRSVGHTGLLWLVLLALGLRSRVMLAIAAGVATHLVLDNLPDLFIPADPPESSPLIALLFPALGVRFPVAIAASLGEHFWRSIVNPWIIAGEVCGAAILGHAWWKARPRS